MIGTPQSLRPVLPITCYEETPVHLPTPELRGHFVETAGPCNQVFHAPSRKQRAVGLQTLYSNVLGISNDASLPQLCRFLGFRAQANRTYASHRGKRTAALLHTLGFVEVCDALFRHYMTDVVPVNHDGAIGMPAFLPTSTASRVSTNAGTSPFANVSTV